MWQLSLCHQCVRLFLANIFVYSKYEAYLNRYIFVAENHFNVHLSVLFVNFISVLEPFFSRPKVFVFSWLQPNTATSQHIAHLEWYYCFPASIFRLIFCAFDPYQAIFISVSRCGVIFASFIRGCLICKSFPLEGLIFFDTKAFKGSLKSCQAFYGYKLVGISYVKMTVIQVPANANNNTAFNYSKPLLIWANVSDNFIALRCHIIPELSS